MNSSRYWTASRVDGSVESPCRAGYYDPAGSVGDMVKRVYDFDFPMTRDAMEFTTRWPGADAQRTTRELEMDFRRCRRHPA